MAWVTNIRYESIEEKKKRWILGTAMESATKRRANLLRWIHLPKEDYNNIKKEKSNKVLVAEDYNNNNNNNNSNSNNNKKIITISKKKNQTRCWLGRIGSGMSLQTQAWLTPFAGFIFFINFLWSHLQVFSHLFLFIFYDPICRVFVCLFFRLNLFFMIPFAGYNLTQY